MFLLTVLVLGAKNLQKLPNRYRHLRLSFATYNSAWSKVSDVSEPLRNTWFGVDKRKKNLWPILYHFEKRGCVALLVMFRESAMKGCLLNFSRFQCSNLGAVSFCWKRELLFSRTLQFAKKMRALLAPSFQQGSRFQEKLTVPWLLATLISLLIKREPC